MPDSTSPLPAVASAGLPVVLTRRRRPSAAMDAGQTIEQAEEPEASVEETLQAAEETAPMPEPEPAEGPGDDGQPPAEGSEVSPSEGQEAPEEAPAEGQEQPQEQEAAAQ